MKIKILMTAFALAGSLIGANAQQEEALVISAGNVKDISIADNLNVVLIPAAEKAVTIQNDAFKKLKVTLTGNSLQIEGQKTLGSDSQVFVLVNELSKLTVGRNVVVNTRGVLNSDKIDVFISNGSTAHLKTTGKVNAHASDENEVSIREINASPAADK